MKNGISAAQIVGAKILTRLSFKQGSAGPLPALPMTRVSCRPQDLSRSFDPTACGPDGAQAGALKCLNRQGANEDRASHGDAGRGGHDRRQPPTRAFPQPRSRLRSSDAIGRTPAPGRLQNPYLSPMRLDQLALFEIGWHDALSPPPIPATSIPSRRKRPRPARDHRTSPLRPPCGVAHPPRTSVLLRERVAN